MWTWTWINHTLIGCDVEIIAWVAMVSWCWWLVYKDERMRVRRLEVELASAYRYISELEDELNDRITS